MELRDPIHGSINITNAEKEVIDSVQFQRLRAIKQLGFTEFSFPAATHNRYIHSIGVSHLASLVFDQIFKNYDFETISEFSRLRQCTRLAALLHDIGHGPLSHTTEEVMPAYKDLNPQSYVKKRTDGFMGGSSELDLSRRADHEDFTIKFLLDSPLTKILATQFPEMSPIHIACLIDKTLDCPDDFFMVNDLDFRPILSQIVSSELDADRMDYLERDAYFCGTNYGRIEANWLIANQTYHIAEGKLHLALNRRALYAFDDFLLSRHHMHLMVYFHHKSIIYEEMLMRYLSSDECTFKLPADINEYISFNDYSLHEHLYKSENPWAQKISTKNPYKVLFELHSTEETNRTQVMQQKLEDSGIPIILANSGVRLSKYHSASIEEKSVSIYVVDEYDRLAKPYPIEASTEIFQKYEHMRRIERLYVEPVNYEAAENFIIKNKL